MGGVPGHLVPGGVPGPGGCVPGPGGCVPAVKVPAQGGVSGPGVCTCPRGVTAWGVYLLRGVYLPGGCTWSKGGVPGPGGCVPAGGDLPRYPRPPPPVNRMTDRQV